ncbi:hypothetical protein KRX11_10090 [Pasteurellaceae bacterium TAE3-ERU1]|uniref:hypothetical protein n=1 Tax=Spirabiliibacterium mucosae TaxID=28156 RepID=UPI001AAC6FF0|nr:hypothetical protein [Spirabiliibacterium mucosae]MBE2898092.1 hypothetical protein [Spirabiliibacterium mucosae]MBV7388983.1 hypothetical protein [Pasteurellaceae bacterium TAE3-ERU1]
MSELDRAKEMLEHYRNAEIAVLKGKTVSFNGRTVSYESLSEIRKGMNFWQGRINELQNALLRTRGMPQYKLARFE